MPSRLVVSDAHLKPLGRGVDIASRRAGGSVIAKHLPRLDRRAQLQLNAVAIGSVDVGDADPREPELRERHQPGAVEVDAVRTQIVHHAGYISQNEVRQQELFVQ